MPLKKTKKILKLKVCGITQMEQYQKLCDLQVPYIGFIFYPPSGRYVGNSKFYYHQLIVNNTHTNNVTAVFVNASLNDIDKAIKQLPIINTIQLHGNETPLMCKLLQKKYTVIKALSVEDTTDIEKLIKPYVNHVHYFLFDTKTAQHGGSGIKYNWNIFINKIIPHPFFVSGGIAPSDIASIKKITHPSFYGVDVNSKFESEIGIKKIEDIETFYKKLIKI